MNAINGNLTGSSLNRLETVLKLFEFCSKQTGLKYFIGMTMPLCTYLYLGCQFIFSIKLLSNMKSLDSCLIEIYISSVLFIFFVHSVHLTNSSVLIVASKRACKKSSDPLGPCGLFNISSFSVVTPRNA